MFPTIQPDWPAPAHVHAFTTLREGGVSLPPYESMNMGMHVNDDPLAVAENRARLQSLLPATPCWLKQEHTTIVVEARTYADPPIADASYAREANRVCVVMTADCLPILVCNRAGTVVSAIHAGWRGLAAGILPITLERLGIPAEETLVWLGPAIGPLAFEVRDDVRQQFLTHGTAEPSHFTALNERCLVDMYAIARSQCVKKGITTVYGGDACTYSDPKRFYSFRRDGETGRMATLIWIGA